MIVAVVLVVLGMSGAIYLATRGPEPTDVVEAYIGAISRGDYVRAYQELTRNAQSSVKNADGLRQSAIASAFANGTVDSFAIGTTKKVGEKAVVEVKLTKGPNEIVVDVVTAKEGGRWRAEL